MGSQLKIPFEKWIESQKLSNPTRELLIESVKCYKADAYRAAFIMSYLGLLSEVRVRLLAPSRPSAFTESDWNGIKSRLLKDERWDSEVYDAIHRKRPAEIFHLSDDLRDQVEYWKNRRNDCAHAKDNQIGSSHVESFWMFIQSNLGKFVVDGSKEGLIFEIGVQFDRSLTPAGIDSQHLVKMIPYAVETSELSAFFRQVEKLIEEKSGTQVHENSDAIAFFDAVFDLEHESTVGSVIKYLAETEKLARSVFRRRPDRVLRFAYAPRYIRKLWYEFLFKSAGTNDMPIYCCLLRNRLIPEAELVEAHTQVLSRGCTPPTNHEDDFLLESTGFFNILYRQAFEEGGIRGFAWANNNAALLTYYLKTRHIDETMARSISSAFNSIYNPRDLRSALNQLFVSNPDKRNECVKVMRDNHVTIPSYLDLETGDDDDAAL